MYKTIEYFEDLQDDRRPYHAGDTFPREGLNVSEKRLEQLSTADNLQGKPLIKFVPEPETVKKRKRKTDANVDAD